MCKQCKQVLKWKSKDGASGLKGHTRSCTVSDKPQAVSIKQMFHAQVLSGGAKIAADDKKVLTDKFARMCGTNI